MQYLFFYMNRVPSYRQVQKKLLADILEKEIH